jgi:hypothetical protein
LPSEIRVSADPISMTISGCSDCSLTSALEKPDAAKDSVAVAMLAKANEQTRQQGAALVQMIDQVVDPASGRLDAYA